ncbi:MAG: VanZ like family protein [Pelotomaculum sp. PtaB.Bin104]|nr:MAG: VanZ like family protein [Pelotomaculum sp. PtaB.Bin104]
MKNTLFIILKNTAQNIALFLPFAYMGSIWYLSSKPSDAVINTGLAYDLLLKEGLHLVEFAVLYVLFVFALLAAGLLSTRTNKIAAILSIFYGFIDECHQYFMPYRSFTMIDLLKDTTGVFIAYFIINRKLFAKKNGRNDHIKS